MTPKLLATRDQVWAALAADRAEIKRVAAHGPRPGDPADARLIRVVFLAVAGDLAVRELELIEGEDA